MLKINACIVQHIFFTFPVCTECVTVTVKNITKPSGIEERAQGVRLPSTTLSRYLGSERLYTLHNYH